MMSSMQQHQHPVAIGTQPRVFVDPTSAAAVDPAEIVVDFTDRILPQPSLRELAEIEAELEAAKADAKAASDRAAELEQIAGAWNLQVAVVESQRARALGAMEAARNGQSHALRRMWELERERDQLFERRRQRTERRRHLQELLASD